MKATAALLLALASVAFADPIKLKDGTIVEGSIARYQPAVIDVVTPTGNITIPMSKLDADFILEKLGSSYEAERIRKWDEMMANSKRMSEDIQRMLEIMDGVIAKSDVETQAVTAAVEAVKSLSAPTPADTAASVLAGIRAKAEEEWPGNYSMQQYEITTQVAAYNKLHPDAPISAGAPTPAPKPKQLPGGLQGSALDRKRPSTGPSGGFGATP